MILARDESGRKIVDVIVECRSYVFCGFVVEEKGGLLRVLNFWFKNLDLVLWVVGVSEGWYG